MSKQGITINHSVGGLKDTMLAYVTVLIAAHIVGRALAAGCSTCSYSTGAGQSYGYVLKLGVCVDNSAYNWVYDASGYTYSPKAFVTQAG
jgi:hypothetical protein